MNWLSQLNLFNSNESVELKKKYSNDFKKSVLARRPIKLVLVPYSINFQFCNKNFFEGCDKATNTNTYYSDVLKLDKA